MEASAHSTIVMIPAYNAGHSLKELADRLRRSVGNIPILVVDDGSQDNTGKIALSIGAIVLRHGKNCGKGAALRTGFDFIQKQRQEQFVVTMDADLQHRPEDVPMFFQVQQKTGADLIIGWRERKGTGMPLHRILSNTVTSALVSIRTGVKIKDSQCGFRLIHRKILKSIRLDSNGYEAETEFLIKAAQHGSIIESVQVQTVYGNEKSYMTHWKTTMSFIKVLVRRYI
jgi:glycosyltransferase involved in cell wall biosynthesis